MADRRSTPTDRRLAWAAVVLSADRSASSAVASGGNPFPLDAEVVTSPTGLVGVEMEFGATTVDRLGSSHPLRPLKWPRMPQARPMTLGPTVSSSVVNIPSTPRMA